VAAMEFNADPGSWHAVTISVKYPQYEHCTLTVGFHYDGYPVLGWDSKVPHREVLGDCQRKNFHVQDMYIFAYPDRMELQYRKNDNKTKGRNG